jgi:hypothetical protein
MKALWLKLSLGLAALLAGAASASASSVDLLETSYTVSNQGAVSVNSFKLDSAGSLTLTMTDLPWPASLQDVSVLLTSSTGATIGQGSGFGPESFHISGPGTVYALTFGQAAPLPGLSYGFGSYGLSVKFQPVPLPPAAALLLSGLGLLAILYRRRPSDDAERPDSVLVGRRG